MEPRPPKPTNPSHDIELQWFWDGLEAYLIARQLKKTKQRTLIVAEFLRLDNHVEVESLYEAVRKKNRNIGLATIYRTLNLLKDAGLVEQNSFADGRAVFEVCKPGDHHDHLICIRCGKVEEFENQAIETLQQEVAVAHGYQLTSHRLDLYGICAACRQGG